MTKIKAVFLDIDNTILDFEAYVQQTLRTGFDDFGVGPFEDWMLDVFHRENDKLWHQIEEKTLTFERLKQIRFNKVFEALGIEADGVAFENYFRDALYDSAILIDGAMELVKGLKEAGYLVCVASNGPYGQQRHRIELAGMKQYFDYYFVSENLGVSKPDPLFFEKAMEIMNRDRQIEPAQCLMVGDSLTSDIAGGINGGLHTCYFKRKAEKDDAKAPTYTIDRLSRVFDVISAIDRE